MNSSRGEVVKCVRFKDMNLEELNHLLSNEFFTLNATDEESLVLGLRARDEFYANRDNNDSFNDKSTYYIFVEHVEEIEHYDDDFDGNRVDKIVFMISDKVIFETE